MKWSHKPLSGATFVCQRTQADLLLSPAIHGHDIMEGYYKKKTFYFQPVFELINQLNFLFIMFNIYLFVHSLIYLCIHLFIYHLFSILGAGCGLEGSFKVELCDYKKERTI